jgi:hypothetical protein
MSFMSSRRKAALALLLALAACARGRSALPDRREDAYVPPPTRDSTVHCDVIVAGGSTAALAAALHSAREGAETCLLEPTDIAGGQLTTEGVSAVDFAWHRVDSLNVGQASRDPANNAPEFMRWLRDLGNPGRCWVSVHCYEPDSLLARHILPAIAAEPKLRVFYLTVVKFVHTEPAGDGTRRIVAVTGNTRGGNGWTFSSYIAERYMPVVGAVLSDDRFTTFRGTGARPPVVIDASAFGDVLVLSGARWLQGADSADGSTATAADTCGLAIVFPFVIAYDTTRGRAADSARAEVGKTIARARGMRPRVDLRLGGGTADQLPEGPYGFGRFDWERVWTYRRLRSSARERRPGDWSMQNWDPGNDYRGAYYLKSYAATRAEAAYDWRGGVRTDVLAAAERQAYGWYRWYLSQAPDSVRPWLRLVVDSGTFDVAGLSRFPYLRDTRRSIGLDDFVLPGSAFVGPASQVTGTVYDDRVAIGAYPFDFRTLDNCAMPAYAREPYPHTLPYFIPFRALTSRDVPNLLVAGKTMAQSTLANTATRLHPTEWNTGIAAGVAAALMHRERLDSRATLARVAELRARIERYAPVRWTIGGKKYPDS